MKRKKLCSIVLACSLAVSCFTAPGFAPVPQSQAEAKKDEYIVQADDRAAFGELKTEMRENDNEVIKHEKEDETYLEENKAMVVSLTKSEAAQLKEEGLTVEKDATLRGSEVTEDGLIYAEPEEIDIEALPKEEEYTADAAEFEPRADVTDPDKKEEVIPWNISCVAGTPHKNKYRGEKVKVAVLDSGIDMHDELYTKQWVDFSDTVNGYKPTDNNGHGTSVAGPIAARISGFGMEGIASGAELYSVKILNKENEASLSTVVKAIEWCIQNDMDIINMSFGMDGYSEILADAVKKAYDNDILMVAAAGNGVEQVQYPARFPQVLSVGSVNTNLKTSEFSDNSQTDLTAPGEDVQSIGFLGSYTKVSGTSLAAAHVTGVAAAVKSADRTLSANQLMEVLKKSAVSLGEDGKLVNYENAVALVEEKENVPAVSKADVAETVQEKAEDESCYVKGSWSKYKWASSIDRGHRYLINSLALSYFKGTVTEQKNYRDITAEAAYLTDDLDYMSASGSGNYGRDENGNILGASSTQMYSPYHAKSQYVLDEVKQHILFLYELARRRIVLGENFSETISGYFGNDYKNIVIPQKMQRRIVADICRMSKESSMSVKLELMKNNKTLADGYKILGVFLHLVQDLQAHRAKFIRSMLFDKNNNFYQEDSFVYSINGTHINYQNIASDNLRQALSIALNNAGGVPMIRLKDYLKNNITITISGVSYTFNEKTKNQVYEDNPYFFSERFSIAEGTSKSYLNKMSGDTENITTLYTYYISGSYSLM